MLRMCDKPEEIAKNGSLMKQRLEKYISGASEK
ncbi:internal head protein [Escherichia phage HX01]|nr:internal head protein [Escherichia phage HX01]